MPLVLFLWRALTNPAFSDKYTFFLCSILKGETELKEMWVGACKKGPNNFKSPTTVTFACVYF